MEGRRPRAILPSGRVSLTLIGRKLLWERKFGKFHTSRSRAVGDINKTNTTLRQAVATTAGKRWNQRLWHHCRTSWSRDTSCGYPFISGTVSAYITAFTLIEETEQEDFFKKKKKISKDTSQRRCLPTSWKKTPLLRLPRLRRAWTVHLINPKRLQSTERFVAYWYWTVLHLFPNIAHWIEK